MNATMLYLDLLSAVVIWGNQIFMDILAEFEVKSIGHFLSRFPYIQLVIRGLK